MMTGETRKIRSYDFSAADEPAESREREGGPVVLDRPYNDNARGTSERNRPPARSADLDADDSDRSDEGIALRVRRRGPLVTRWIGHAALRRQAQARVNRMRGS